VSSLAKAANSDVAGRSRQLNVLLLLHWMRTDGSGVYYARLAKALAKRGHKVVVASTGGPLVHELKCAGIRHHCVRLLGLEYAAAYARFFEIVDRRVLKYFKKWWAEAAANEGPDLEGDFRWGYRGLKVRGVTTGFWFVVAVVAALARLTILVKKEGIEVIEAHSTGAAALAFCCNWLLGIPYVVNVSAPRLAGLARSVFPAINATAGSIIAISEECALYLNRGFVRPRKIGIIHGVVDLQRFRRLGIEENREYLGSLREKGFDMGEHTKKVGILGRLDEDKRNSIISSMLAMPIIRKDIQTAQLVVAGDGAIASEVQQLAAKINGETGSFVVAVIGHEERPERLMNVCDVILGVGTVAIEAMACEAAVIVAGHRVGPQGGSFGGVVSPENVKELAGYYFTGRNGREETSPEVIAEACTELLRHDEYRNRLGVFGRQFVEEFCNVDKTVLSIENIYRGILGKGTAANCERPD